MFTYKKIVPQELLVPEYDHVHHAQIVSILEEGRLKLLEAIGHPQEGLVSAGIFLVITGLSVRFLREVRGEEILVTCEDINIDGRYFRMKQRILRPERQKEMVTADIELMVIDKSVGRAVNIPEFLKRSLFEQKIVD